MSQYVVVRLTNDKQRDSFHIYSKTSSKKETMIAYMETLKKKYPNDTTWRVMTDEQAQKKRKEYRIWYEKYDEARWDRAMKNIERKSLADRGWIKQNLMSRA